MEIEIEDLLAALNRRRDELTSEYEAKMEILDECMRVIRALLDKGIVE